MKTCVCSNHNNYVRVGERKDWSRLFAYLLQNGYKNPHELTEKTLPSYMVVCVDETNKWFCSVNVTIMACITSVGKKVVSTIEYLG